MLGSVDSYGHLIVSKLDTTGKGRFFFILIIMMLLFLLISFDCKVCSICIILIESLRIVAVVFLEIYQWDDSLSLSLFDKLVCLHCLTQK